MAPRFGTLQAAAASALGAPCLRVLSVVRDSLELSCCAKLFPQTACFERHSVQDEALYKCHLLLFEDPALEAQSRRVVPKGYMSLAVIPGGVSKPYP